jgi:hypothetical protein
MIVNAEQEMLRNEGPWPLFRYCLSIIMDILRNATTDFGQDGWKSPETAYC